MPVDQATNFADRFAAVANENPDATALIVTADRLPISYRDVARLTDHLAEKLQRAGLSPGDRIALRAPSDVAYVIGLLAILRAKMVAVPLDPSLPGVDQLSRATTAGARAVLMGEAKDPVGPALPCWTLSVILGQGSHPAAVEMAASSPPLPSSAPPEGLRSDDAMIMFTGGTTGSPKMVPWTHHNIITSVDGVIATYRLGPQDATVAAMPLFHGHGLIAALLSTLISGGTVLLPAGGRFSAQTFWADIRAAGATWFTAVPTIHRILLGRATADDADRRAVTLRFIRSCSAALDPKTAHALRTEFDAPVLVAFGMTEATHQATSMRLDQEVSSGLIGRPTGPEARIVGDDGRACPPEHIGELQLRGDTIVRGYLANPDANAKNFTDGWLHTGDLASMSATGELSLRGRIKELINRGGEKISPEHVEDVLAGHPDIAEVAVFGMPDELYGETVTAAIVSHAATAPTSADLAEFCQDQLAPYEIPASIQVVNELPHTAKGSVDRRAVVQKFGSGTRS